MTRNGFTHSLWCWQRAQDHLVFFGSDWASLRKVTYSDFLFPFSSGGQLPSLPLPSDRPSDRVRKKMKNYAEESANYAEKTTDNAEISNETIAASQLISKKTITASPLTSNKTITATPLISTQSTVKTINGNINKLLPRIWVHYIF